MIGVRSYSDKAIDAVARNRAALERSTAQLEQHDTIKPAGDDGDALFNWKRERRDLEDRVAANREALAFAEERAEEARATAATTQAKVKNADMDRAAKAAEKRVRAIFTLQEKLAEELAWLGEHVDEFRGYNTGDRGDLPFVPDAEWRVRQRLSRGRPAITEERDVWVDAQGSAVPRQVNGRDGMLIDNPDVVGRGKRTFILVPELPATPEMPDRVCESVRLVDLAGNILWDRLP